MPHFITGGGPRLRALRLAALLALLLGSSLIARPMSAHAAQTPCQNVAPGERCFPETDFRISGRIREFWENEGGLPVFGLPISAQYKVPGTTIVGQLFERNRLELHPENARPYDVLIGRLGEAVLVMQNRVWQSFPKVTVATSGCQLFETGHQVCEPFLSYWRSHGLNDPSLDAYGKSLALFGLPLSDASMETNSSGQTVMTQWFERARFEYVPTNPDPYKVLLGRLGAEANRTP